VTFRSENPAFRHPRPSFLQAVQLAKARKGPPTENDRLSARPLPGRKVKVLPGQLNIYGDEAA
jgi:hypothetical protein